MTLAGLEAGYRDIDPLAVPGNVLLQNARGPSDGTFTFDTVSLPNAIITLERSSDLRSWSSWLTNLLRSGISHITDTRTNGVQFYRGHQLQP